jgi:hypothetical protein
MDQNEYDQNSIEGSSAMSTSWNTFQEDLLKGISERSNCMRWLHNQCQIHFESLNFYFTIPNVIISTLNGSVTMSLTALFPNPDAQRVATTIIGLISIFSAILITMNQYVKSQQMMEAHRAAGLAYGKLHRLIMNEMAMRRDQRSNAMEFLKNIRQEQDRLENSSPSILPSIIKRFNREFKDRDIEKPEIAGDLDETNVNHGIKTRRRLLDAENSSPKMSRSPSVPKMVRPPSVPAMKKGTKILPTYNPPPIIAKLLAEGGAINTDESIPENIIVERP